MNRSRHPLRPRRTLTLWLGLLATCLPATQFAETEWTLVWADEFEIDGAPNPDHWNYEEGFIRNNEKQYYTRGRLENARVENGNLVIEARRDNWEGNEYTSASVITKDRASWTYGRFEIMAKIPTGRGMWPAIWTLGTNFPLTSWPLTGEIDIMENVGFEPDEIHANIHTEAFNHEDGTNFGDKITVTDPWADFHLYAMEWYPDRIDIFFDDTKYFTFENTGNGVEEWPFFEPQYLLLNIAVGGNWGGLKGINDSIFPQQFLIDYVRVYQQAEAPPYTLTIQTEGPGVVHTSTETLEFTEATTVDLFADPDIGARFLGWEGAQVPNDPRVSLEVNRDIVLKARFESSFTESEVLINNGFNVNRDGWIGPFPPDGVQVFTTSDQGYLGLNITQPGTENWHVQILQLDVELEQGVSYVFSFDAWSDEPQTFFANVGLNREPWSAFGFIVPETTSTPQTFSTEFFMQDPSLSDARVAFEMGTASGQIYIDNVSLIKKGGPQLTGYEAWKAQNQIRPLWDHDDRDGDTLPAIVEYKLGLDPDQYDVMALGPTIHGTQLHLPDLPVDPLATDVDLLWERSVNLVDWSAVTQLEQAWNQLEAYYFRLAGRKASE